MTRAKSISEPPTPETERPARRKRARKKRYSDEIYGARLAHEDARIVDEFARQKRMDRSDVVRLGMHQFALRQAMKYKPKDSFDELQERVYREHFAAVHEQLEAVTSTLTDMPHQFIELNSRTASRFPSDADDDSTMFPSDGTNTKELVLQVERALHEQRRTLEPMLLASTLSLRLLINYVVEPRLGALDLQNPQTVTPLVRHAARGKDAWNLLTVALMKITGDQVMRELGLLPPEEKIGTHDAQTAATEAQRLVSALLVQAGIMAATSTTS